MRSTTVLVRDFSAIDGGGHAEVHVTWCDHLTRRLPAMPGVIVTHERFERTTPDLAAAAYAARFTVPVEMRTCACVAAHVRTA